MTTNTISRKEIAAVVGVSVMTVIRRQRDWNLNKCVCPRSRRPILYIRSKVLAELSRLQVLITD